MNSVVSCESRALESVFVWHGLVVVVVVVVVCVCVCVCACVCVCVCVGGGMWICECGLACVFGWLSSLDNV